VSPVEIAIDVADTGVGIAPDDQERVFEEFFQVKGPLQTGGGARASGLPYARRVVHALGGDLTLRSRPGEGQHLHGQPAAPLGRLARPGGVAVRRAPSPSTSASCCSSTTTRGFRRILRGMLQGMAGQIIEAASGQEGLDRMETMTPDVVFLDLRMPDMDGAEVLTRMEQRSALRDVPVVIVSSVDLSGPGLPGLGRSAAALAKASLDRPLLQATLADVLTARSDRDRGTVTSPSSAQSPSPSPAPPPSERATILVVDDVEVPPLRRRHLAPPGRLRRGRGGHRTEALDAVDAHEVDLVTLDVNLPDMSGMEVCERIKGAPRTAAVPILHLSATAVETTDRNEGLRRGADAYLSNRSRATRLLATVNALLRYSAARRRAVRVAGYLRRLHTATLAAGGATSPERLAAAAAEGASAVFDAHAVVRRHHRQPQPGRRRLPERRRPALHLRTGPPRRGWRRVSLPAACWRPRPWPARGAARAGRRVRGARRSPTGRARRWARSWWPGTTSPRPRTPANPG
jgi:CheY-like chemotaxis protein